MTNFLGLIVGLGFGAALVLSSLANPDKIIGTLRLKDFHAMRVIAVFLLVGMVGVWTLELVDLANLSIKPAAMLALAVGGALLGVGFGLTGYCPGTGLAAAATGRVDALVAVLGMFAGTAVYVATWSWIGGPIFEIANAGKLTLPAWSGVPKVVWVTVLATLGAAVLYATRDDRHRGAKIITARHASAARPS